MTSWLRRLETCLRLGAPCVLVTVASTRGSTPREIGAKMLVTEQSSTGSIGGGQLEYQCVEIARRQLRDDAAARPAFRSKTFPLGANCGQCCGGVAEILFEAFRGAQPWAARLGEHLDAGRSAVVATLIHGAAPVRKLLITADGYDREGPADELSAKIARTGQRLLSRSGPAEKRIMSVSGNVKVPVLFEPVRPPDFNVLLFGAGHVGSAMVRVLGELPCRVRWIDSRAELMNTTVPDNVVKIVAQEPEVEVAKAPPESYFLVMTHSHPLDQAICNRVLERRDFAYCGLIGSQSKKRRFEKRFRALGFSEAAIRAITCPIGVVGISGKRPGEIAVAAAAEILRVRERAVTSSAASSGSSLGGGGPNGRRL